MTRYVFSCKNYTVTPCSLAWTLRADWTGKEEVILNLSGRGDKDLKNYIQMPGER